MQKNKRLQINPCHGLLFTLLQVMFGLPIAFSASVEGFVIKIKPAAPVPEDNAISLKAKSRHNFWTEQLSEKSTSQKSRNAYIVASLTLVWA